MKNDDEKLDLLLRQWRCSVEEDPHFDAEVWRRIAAREESPWSDARTAVSGWFEWLPGPAMAATLFLGAILGGIGAAELRVQSVREYAAIQDQERAYFESINPVALARHEVHR